MNKIGLIIIILTMSLLSNNWEYSEIVPLKGSDKNEIYNKLILFTTINLKRYKYEIKTNNKEDGTIIIRGSLTHLWDDFSKISRYDDGIVFYTLKVNIKDGEYRYTIDNIYHKSKNSDYNIGFLKDSIPDCSRFKVSQKQFNQIKQDIQKQINILITELQEVDTLDLTIGSEIVFIEKLNGLNSQYIYTGAMVWLSEYFNSVTDVIKYNSKEDGKIICKGVTSFHTPLGQSFDKDLRMFFKDLEYNEIRYTMTIDIKNEKIRLTFSNMTAITMHTELNFQSTWKEARHAVEKIKDLFVLGVKNNIVKQDKNW